MYRRSRSSLVWILIISLVVLLIAAVLGLGGGLINFIDKHANIIDSQYLPMDLERARVEELKKKFEQKRSQSQDKPGQ